MEEQLVEAEKVEVERASVEDAMVGRPAALQEEIRLLARALARALAERLWETEEQEGRIVGR